MLTLEYYPESPSLTGRSKPVELLTDVRSVLQEMWHFMVANDGIGLAAPQVGVNKRMFVTGFDDMRYVVNPQLLNSVSVYSIAEEGCLSLILLRGDVKRSDVITVRYTDITGVIVTRKLTGWQARVFLHEYDHLEGWLFPFYKIKDAEKGFYKPDVWSFWNDWKLELMYADV
jgi:peptide deformylase